MTEDSEEFVTITVVETHEVSVHVPLSWVEQRTGHTLDVVQQELRGCGDYYEFVTERLEDLVGEELLEGDSEGSRELVSITVTEGVL